LKKPVQALPAREALAAFDDKGELDPRDDGHEPDRRGLDCVGIPPKVWFVEQDGRDSRAVDDHQRHMPVSS
jgi:hypothetical protein